jgi:hypothetical protein
MEPINYSTKQLEKQRVDAALAALGLTPEHLDTIDHISINTGTVTIRQYIRKDNGPGITLGTTNLGHGAAYIEHHYDIVPDGTGETIDDVSAYHDYKQQLRNGLSDAEARATAWPEPKDAIFKDTPTRGDGPAFA